MADPVYNPPISPNVDLIFVGTNTYNPPVSPNVDIVFGATAAALSGGGSANSNSEFFLLFF